MAWLLCLGHALLGALVLPAAFLPGPTRRRAIEVASVLGAGLGVALVFAGESGAAGWRTVGFEPRFAAPAGVAAAAAWVVTGALAGRRGRAEEVALTGVAATGLVLAATGRYVVPALIFWLCSSAALAAAARVRGRWIWAVLASSDAAVCVAALGRATGDDAWAFGGAATGLTLAALAAGAVVRGAAHLGPVPAATAPLLTGGALVLAARAATAEPWAAAAVLAGAGAALVFGRTGPGVAATWVTAVAIASCFVAPELAPLAGVTAVLATTLFALWPYTQGRGGVARALATSLVPLTAGFGIVFAASGEAFERATASASLPWTLVAILLPATLAAGVVLGGRTSRADAREFLPEAVLATWLLLAGIVGLALFPKMAGDAAPLGDSGGVFALQVVALAAGAAAGVGARRSGVTVEPAYRTLDLAGPPVAELPRPAAWVALALAVATVAASGWVTVSGLRVGFL